MKTLRANLWMLLLTGAICSGLYPALLYGFGQAFVSSSGDGSLIAQPFSNDEYFWARPSAASYNAAAAGGSNWGGSNPKLRDRVAQQLAPIIAYKPGTRTTTPQQDMEAWYATQPNRDPEVKPLTQFDAWLRDPANHDRVADLEPVPADMVTASGSGLDPHITLRNAHSVYQLDRVAKKRSTPAEFETVKRAIAELAREMSFVPLSGLVGEPLVNVLELNRAMESRFPVK